METKIKYKVEERTYRNNMGQLHIGYITRLLVGKKIDETAFAAALGKATNMSVPTKTRYIQALTQKPCSDTKATGWCFRYGFNHHQIPTVR